MLELHPRNHGFEWKSHSGPFELLTPEQAEQYNEQGYVLIKGAFSKDELAAVTDEIDPVEHEMEEFLRQQEGGKAKIAKADAITFTTHLVTRSPDLKAFARHDVFRKLCRDTMGQSARLYWDQAVYKKPGNPEEFPWHQDNGYTYIEPQQYLTCWVPLVDATVENGCPWVVPGLHRSGTLKHVWTDIGWQCLEQPENAVPVEAEAGDIVVFSSLTPHRTGPNLTKDVRKAYILQYAPDGVVAYAGEAEEGVLQDDPDRQFEIEPA